MIILCTPVLVHVKPGEVTFSGQVSNADVIIPTTAKVGQDVILAAKNLKLVVNPATGYNNIAVATCAAQGVPVCTAPGESLFAKQHTPLGKGSA